VAITRELLPLLKKSQAGRIVNLSSILASNALHADPNSPIYNFKSFAYDASKSALNAFTTHLAWELRDTPIKVNSAHPGWVKTEMGTDAAPMEIPEGAKTSVELALIGADGPHGRFIHLGQELPW
jgi:NAD(P)-dependent dehydrogenase (short-subunit alcohol dehydrogenase family)